MGIETVAFDPANAFYMNIQMNMQVKKGIKRMRAALEAGDFCSFSILSLKIGIA
jgi:hypothetical protein